MGGEPGIMGLAYCICAVYMYIGDVHTGGIIFGGIKPERIYNPSGDYFYADVSMSCVISKQLIPWCVRRPGD